MTRAPIISPDPTHRPGSSLRWLFATEALGVVSGALITVGLPFFTHHQFGWGMTRNFLLAAGQGVAYVAGALGAQPAAARYGRRVTLSGLFRLLGVVGAVIAAVSAWGAMRLFVVLVLAETALMAATWPVLESMVARRAPPGELSRNLGRYNTTWAVVGALTMAATGVVVEHAPVWVFFAIASAGHLACWAAFARCRDRTRSDASRATDPRGHDTGGDSESAQAAQPDPKLVHQRRLALWLSRISLPATYVVVYSLAPMLPSLPALQWLSPTLATPVASFWLVARAATFVVTGKTSFWHTRPGLLLWAAAVMLVAFVGVVASSALAEASLTAALAFMVASQVVLGVTLGLIYAGSLYFGMVLGRGSTAHGGYHEALIGLGQALGPGVGAVALWMRPGDLWATLTGVSTVIAISLAVAATAKVMLERAAQRCVGSSEPRANPAAATEIARAGERAHGRASPAAEVVVPPSEASGAERSRPTLIRLR